MKRVFLCLLGVLAGGVMNAQHSQGWEDFRREAGDHADLFLGKVEPGYSSAVYIGHPYAVTDDFTTGEVVYKGLTYRDVSIRYDAYLKQLVVSTPEKHTHVYVPMQEVEKFTLGGTGYERRNGEMMAILFSSPRMELVERTEVSVREELVGQTAYRYRWVHRVKYGVLRDGQMFEVDKLNSVLKLYPDIKKELKRWAKAKKLNFGEHRRSSLLAVIMYADECLTNPKERRTE